MKDLVCLYSIFLLFHLSSIVFFLTSPWKLSTGENQRALHLAYDCRVRESTLLTEPWQAIHCSLRLFCVWIFISCRHANRALTHVHWGQRKLCTWDCETGRTSEQMVLLDSWVMLRNTFLLGAIIWLHFLIKVDLCDGYVIYIFLPLFLWESGCISSD